MTIVEVGHTAPGAARVVTTVKVPELQYPTPQDPWDVTDIAVHLQRHPDGVTQIPDHEAFLSIAHPDGALRAHGAQHGTVQWVRSDDAALAALVAEWYEVPAEAPEGLEDLYFTRFGPPGVGPAWGADIEALLNDGGRDLWAQNLWSAGTSATIVGDTGTATVTTTSSLTGSGGATHATNDSQGQVLVCLSSTGGQVYGIVASNTSGATPVFTVDRWYNPANPGGAVGTQPAASTFYLLLAGGPPMLFMGISANNSAPAVGDNYSGGAANWVTNGLMTGEIATAGGGLIPKITVGAHTAGTNTLTATATFTANGSDTLPVTIAKMGIGPSILAATRRGLQTLLSATATLNVSGDQLTITDTITGS